MSGLPSIDPSGLPPINPAVLPADVRNGTPQHRQAYETALGFEQMLVEQLTQSLAASAQPDTSSDSSDGSAGSSDGSGGADPATQDYMNMLPQVLAQSITAAGGLGLARTLVPAPAPADGSGAQPGSEVTA